jgi:predicted DNA binding CopG/RHH family protein
MNRNSNLTAEEKAILESFERGETRSTLTAEMRQEYVASARQTFRKDKRVNIRLSRADLELLQERALIEGVPYQTLMSSILHKYVHGRLREDGGSN